MAELAIYACFDVIADRYNIPQLYTAFARSYDRYIAENRERENEIVGFDLKQR